MSNLNDALAFAPQAAVIATPSIFHIETAQRLADSGAHLLVEKPLAASSSGVQQLLLTCSARKLVLMTAYNLRFLPSLQEYRRLIQSRCVGRVLSVRCEVGQYLPSWRPGTDYRHGVSASRMLGGGVLLELSHEIDYLRWIFGEVVWVQAVLKKQSDLEIDVEDTAHLLLGFEKDALGRNPIASLNMDFVRRDTTRKCVAIGEFGSLRWNGLSGAVDLFPADGKVWEPRFMHLSQRDESYTTEWQHFLNCIANNAPPMISGRDGLSTIRVIEAARRSAELNQSVLVESVV
jgi:predicted dehydrogenase